MLTLRKRNRVIMSAIELPDWYVLKKPENLTVEIKDLIDFANERIDGFLAEDPWVIIRNELFSDEEWQKVVVRELGGHLFLRVAVSPNPRLVSWLVEVEGDLFEFRFNKVMVANENKAFFERVAILKDLYGDENIITVNELNELFHINVYKKFNIAEVPRTTKRRGFGYYE